MLDRLAFRFFRDRGEAISALAAAEVDVVSGLYAEHVRDAQLNGQTVIAGSQPSSFFLAFQVRMPPFEDLRVRQAVRAGLDLNALVEQFHPGATVASTLTPPGLLEGEFPVPARPDVSRSRALLRDAGVSVLRLTLYNPPGRSTEAEDQVLFGPLVTAGLVELVHIELASSDFWARAHDGRLAVFRAGWIADYPDADNFLHFLLNSRAQTVYGLGYQNADLDRLTNEARVSIDPARRQELYRSAERLLGEDCPLIPLYHDRSYAAANPKVQGLRLHQTPPTVRFDQLWLDSADA